MVVDPLLLHAPKNPFSSCRTTGAPGRFGGVTDEQLGDELGLSLSAVKKTWRSVYDRASKALLDEIPLGATDDIETKRGKEKKQHLLAYLRGHREELRPVLPREKRTRAVAAR